MRTSLQFILSTAGAALLLGSLAARVHADILYVTNSAFNSIQRFTGDGDASIFASDGMNLPLGLAFDSTGNLYAANNSSNTIEKFTIDGMGSVFASGAALNFYSNPAGLAFDSAGNLYTGSSSGASILKITPTGAISLFATGDLRKRHMVLPSTAWAISMWQASPLVGFANSPRTVSAQSLPKRGSAPLPAWLSTVAAISIRQTGEIAES
jgi:hypothetical protein